MFKYELEQKVFYLRNNRIHSAPILARKYIDNIQHEHLKFKDPCIEYETCHATFNEDVLFKSKSDLVKQLLEG